MQPSPLHKAQPRIADGNDSGTRLIGDGFESEIPQELDGPDALPDLLVRLLVESGVTHHPAA